MVRVIFDTAPAASARREHGREISASHANRTDLGETKNTVVRLDRAGKELPKNRHVYSSSPVIVDGRIVLETHDSLWRIGEQ
jgi:hypothetical protein